MEEWEIVHWPHMKLYFKFLNVRLVLKLEYQKAKNEVTNHASTLLLVLELKCLIKKPSHMMN
jgi:hypothetical protein